MSKRLVAGIALMTTVLVGTGGAVGSIAAQDSATPPMSGQESAGISTHPAHIHAGTCDTLGDVVFPLSDVSAGDAAATPAATPTLAMASTPDAGTTLQSTTTVEAALDDIISGGHAINVHQSAEQIDVYIACGDVTGEATNGMLTVELQELNGSGVSGQAMLTDNGDGTTTVEIHLMPSGSTMATPAA
jgi:hypothetical protein